MSYKMKGFSGFGNSPMKKNFTEQQMKILKKDPRANLNPTPPGKIDYKETDIRKRGGSHAHSFTKTIADTIKSFKTN